MSPSGCAAPAKLSKRREGREVPWEWRVGTEAPLFVLFRVRKTLRNALETVLSCSNRIGVGGGVRWGVNKTEKV